MIIDVHDCLVTASDIGTAHNQRPHAIGAHVAEGHGWWPLHRCRPEILPGKRSANVRYWTKADNGQFWPAMVCPLLTVVSTDRRNTLSLTAKMEFVVMWQGYRR